MFGRPSNGFSTLKQLLAAEVTAVRTEAARTEAALRAEIAGEIAACRAEIQACRNELGRQLQDHREAILHLDMSKRTVAGLRGGKPALLS